jgi:hypothetical protein
VLLLLCDVARSRPERDRPAPPERLPTIDHLLCYGQTKQPGKDLMQKIQKAAFD